MRKRKLDQLLLCCQSEWSRYHSCQHGAFQSRMGGRHLSCGASSQLAFRRHTPSLLIRSKFSFLIHLGLDRWSWTLPYLFWINEPSQYWILTKIEARLQHPVRPGTSALRILLGNLPVTGPVGVVSPHSNLISETVFVTFIMKTLLRAGSWSAAYRWEIRGGTSSLLCSGIIGKAEQP